MWQDYVRVFAGSLLYSAMLRTIRHKCSQPMQKEYYHFVFAHSDDELLILKQLRIIAGNKNLSAGFTLLTNSSHGYDKPFDSMIGHIASRDDFGRLRVTEFNDSLRAVGINNGNIEALIDEHSIYEMLTTDRYQELASMLDSARDIIASQIEERKPAFVFVDDFAGGHLVHDLANYITCCAARKVNYHRVIELPQYFLSILGERPQVILGDIGYDDRGRLLRDSIPGKYTPYIPALGIRHGRAFNGPLDLIRALQHKARIYSSQKKTVDRLLSQRISYGLDAPRFRQVDLERMDHAIRPGHGVLYEHCPWRQRDLLRLPTFEDFKAFVEFYNRRQFSQWLTRVRQ